MTDLGHRIATAVSLALIPIVLALVALGVI